MPVRAPGASITLTRPVAAGTPHLPPASCCRRSCRAARRPAPHGGAGAFGDRVAVARRRSFSAPAPGRDHPRRPAPASGSSRPGLRSPRGRGAGQPPAARQGQPGDSEWRGRPRGLGSRSCSRSLPTCAEPAPICVPSSSCARGVSSPGWFQRCCETVTAGARRRGSGARCAGSICGSASGCPARTITV